MTRHLSKIAAALAVALPVVLAMAGCAGSAMPLPESGRASEPTAEALAPTPGSVSDSDPAPATDADASVIDSAIVLVDAGAEPRISLQTTPGTTTTVMVMASETDKTSFANTSDQRAFSGDYDLDLTTTAAPNGFTLVTDRTVRTLDAAGPPPDVDAIVGFRQNYDEAGLPIYVINEQEDAYRRLSGGLLSTPNLLLTAPIESVGVGATWTIPVDRSGELLAEVSLLAINDSTVEIELSFVHTTDDGTFSMTASGTYDRTSLLAHDVMAVSTLTLDTEASANGQLVPARSEQESIRIYQEISS